MNLKTLSHRKIRVCIQWHGEQSKWINHILCLPKKNALEDNRKSFFPSLSPLLHRGCGDIFKAKADDLFITSAREKNMITFVMKYVPTSYLMPLFMFRAFSSFLKLAQSSATKSVRLSSAKTLENFFQGPAAALCIKTINFYEKINASSHKKAPRWNEEEN